jgi:hypothetical protein
MPGLGYGLGLNKSRSGQLFNVLFYSPTLWYDFSNPATTYQSNGGSLAAADGDPIGYQLDLSTNTRHASQTDGTKKPLLKTGANGINGRPVAQFDNVNDVLTFTKTNLANTGQTIFFVYQPTATVGTGAYGGGGIILGNDPAAGDPELSLIGVGSQTVLLANERIAWLAYNATPWSGYGQTSEDISGVNIFQFSLSSDNGAAYKRNNTTKTLTQSTSGFSTTNYPRYYQNLGSGCYGKIGEIIVLPSDLSVNNKALFYNYLATKWGL